MSLPRLLVLTDRAQLPEGITLRAQIASCVEAGATHVVLRELDLSPSVRAALTEEFKQCGAVVVSARERVIGAAGLHQSSAARGPVRHFTGRSCHTREEVEIAALDRCSYVTLGPFAATDSKPGYGPSCSPDSYRDLPLPAYALGGIDTMNAEAARRAGAYGVAVMGAVMRSREPGAIIRDLLRRIS